MEVLETFDIEGVRVEIIQDEDPMNPRTDFDNAGKLRIFSGRGNFRDVDELDFTLRTDDYSGWEDMEESILSRDEFKGALILPVFRFEHSSIAYNTTGFNDSWDSGRVGFIIIDRPTMVKEWGKVLCTKAVRAKAQKYLEGEIETYSQWANSEVYGYRVFDPEDEDETEESCWGFYGMDYCISEATSVAEHMAKRLLPLEQRQQQRKVREAAAAAERAGQLALPV